MGVQKLGGRTPDYQTRSSSLPHPMLLCFLGEALKAISQSLLCGVYARWNKWSNSREWKLINHAVGLATAVIIVTEKSWRQTKMDVIRENPLNMSSYIRSLVRLSCLLLAAFSASFSAVVSLSVFSLRHLRAAAECLPPPAGEIPVIQT